MKTLLWMLLILGLLGCDSAGNDDDDEGNSGNQETFIGIIDFETNDVARERLITGTIWFPARDVSPKETVILDSFFPAAGRFFSSDGEEVRNARYFPGGRAPLIVMSHRHQGRETEGSWLAQFLSEQGYIVLSLRHPGDSYGNHDAAGGLRVWDRAQDLTFALNQVLQHPVLGDRIDQSRIGAVGQGIGADSILLLLGGQYDFAAMQSFCDEPDSRTECQIFQNVDFNAVDLTGSESQRIDPRIQVAFFMGPVLGPGFTKERLADVITPIHIVAIEHDEHSPLQANGQFYHDSLRDTELTVLTGDGRHFVFLPVCNALGRQSEPHHCVDAPGVDREQYHIQMRDTAFDFFEKEFSRL